MEKYVDIKAAAELTGKSERTIRRLIEQAESNPEEVKYIRREAKAVYIDRQFLSSKYVFVGQTVQKGNDTDMVKMLKAQVEELKRENQQKDVFIKMLMENQSKMMDNLRLEQFKALPESERKRVLDSLEQKFDFDADYEETSES